LADTIIGHLWLSGVLLQRN